MAQVVADVLKANIEAIADDIPALFELEGYAAQKIRGAAKSHLISKTPNGADFRAPIEVQPTGKFGSFSLAGGSLGVGSGFKIEQFTQTYFPLKLGIEFNWDTSWTTEKPSQSVVNAMRKNIKDAIPVAQRMDDASFHNITGNQGLFALATAYAANVFTCANEFGADLALEGMPVEIYSNDLLTHRSSAVTPDSLPTITAVDKANKKITVTGLGAITPSADDYLGFEGAGTTPSWLTGLYHFNNTATSGTLLGLSRSTYPQINSNAVSGSGGWTPELGYDLYARIRQSRGKVKKLMGLISLAQYKAVMSRGTNISEWHRGKNDAMIDIFPKIQDSVTICGVEHHIDEHLSRQRIDWIDLDTWGRVYIHDGKGPQFLKNLESGNGGYLFVKRNSGGTVSAATLIYLTWVENYYCNDPGRQGMIHSLPLPSNF